MWEKIVRVVKYDLCYEPIIVMIFFITFNTNLVGRVGRRYIN